MNKQTALKMLNDAQKLKGHAECTRNIYQQAVVMRNGPRERFCRPRNLQIGVIVEQITRDYCRTLINGKPCAFCYTNSCGIGNSPRHCFEVEQARLKAKESQATDA